MKGLLIKDFYMMKAYCKSYLLIAVVFLGASFFGNNLFLVYYPCLLCGMIPVNLLAYDERSRFVQYGAALPVSRAQAVSEKYIIGLLSQAAVLIVTGAAQGIRMASAGTFVFREFAVLIISLALVSTIASSIPLPFIFRFGVEKGRIAYYVMVGFVCAASFIFSKTFVGDIEMAVSPEILFPLMLVAAVGLYILSWYLSVVFYKKREL